MGKDFTVILDQQSPRAKDFQEIFGRTTVHVKSPIAALASLAGKGEAPVYMLDLELLTPEEYNRLVDFIMRKFNAPRQDVIRSLETDGLPILAEDCTLAISNPQRWID